nr:alkaline phosphatase family protein [Halobaculum rubrum]
MLDPLRADGVLPTLGSLFDRFAVGDLESQLPPWSPSAWPSLYTGVNPGNHGVFDLISFDGYDWDLVDRGDVHEHAIWELLDQRGLRSVEVNVQVTDPPRPIDGALVPGWTVTFSLTTVSLNSGTPTVVDPAARLSLCTTAVNVITSRASTTVALASNPVTETFGRGGVTFTRNRSVRSTSTECTPESSNVQVNLTVRL